MLDNTEPIKCVVKNCEKSYNTFRGLSYHLNTFDHQRHDVCYTIIFEKIIKYSNFRLFQVFQVENIAHSIDCINLTDETCQNGLDSHVEV